MSDKSWKPEHSLIHSLIHSLLTCWTTFVFMSMLKSHTLSSSHTLTLTLSLSHSLTLNMLNNFCFHVYAQKSLSHFHTLALSHFHTLSMSHSITLDMLNKFCFHVYDHKSLFIAENCNAFFVLSSSTTLPCYFRCHRAGSQLKIKLWRNEKSQI